MPLRSVRRTYNRVAVQGEDAPGSTEENANSLDEPLSPSTSFDGEDEDEENKTVNDPLNQSGLASEPQLPPIQNEINVNLLDGATKKFTIKCDPAWTVAEFKTASAVVTKVPPNSQRLIHMGKLLQDDATLSECGINASEKIIHLFPKPNVVINNDNGEDGNYQSTTNNNGSGDNEGTEGGAHVPQIVLDAEEASRRSQILILSSTEIFEAQHRVKIFSFLLMIISSMELLTLMTLFVGVQAEDNPYGGSGEVPPGNPTDEPTPSSQTMQIRTWQNSDYADTVISAFGFYVSLLGIRATTENTLQLAKQYFACITVAAIASNCYYYYLNVQQEEKFAQQNNKTIDEHQLHTDAFVGILLPLTVWALCVIRAYQFQTLIREAEREAEERTRDLIQSTGGDGEGGGGGEASAAERSLPYGSGETVTSQSSPSDYNDLELRVEQGVST
mmetsp:Transcript_3790/g.5698  ORF Transcript_3790/g.5698 Transcript_3790/m.5698 type:complete len:445 (+) Transcript_3790:51-1385(+)